MIRKTDFTNCKRILGKAYNGANGKKISIEYEGEKYMLKFPPSADKKPNDLSYANSCISEHIASSIFNILGIKAHQTRLGEFHVGGKTKVVCACKDFAVDGKVLYDFCSIKNTVIDSEHGGTGTELDDILETIERQQFVNPEKLLEYFWDMFVGDAFLGNFDRHNGNWGFLYDDKAQISEIAPVFDCGSCLLPQADENIMKKVLESEEELNSRIFVFPTSASKLNGTKINYYKFLTAAQYEECNKAVLRIAPKINLSKIENFINEVPYITELQKEFYKKYISSRYELLIKPAFEQIQKNGQAPSEAELSI